jgi:peptide/nickel transport system ATP-binding protein
MLKLKDLRAYYQTPRGTVKAVDGVTFDIRENEILGIAGESGCGKSTLLKVLYDYVQPPLKIVSGEYKAEMAQNGSKVTLGPGVYIVCAAGFHECAEPGCAHRESVL